jgi:hypothetical protein
MTKDTVYRDRQGGQWTYWTYSDGRTVYISETLANRWVAKRTARIVKVRTV